MALTLVTLARWEAGLLTRAEDVERIQRIADLGHAQVRLVAREQGAGAQRLLERELRAAGIPIEVARKAPFVAAGHLDVAWAIAMKAADAGVATRDAAMAFGLRFLPLAEEMCLELGALGYDVARVGQRVAEVRAA